jgi:two-component system, NarL family, invasion response regulator UvrY
VIKVLIADDHLLLREGLKLILEDTGDIQVVEEALNGREVLDKADKDIDVIVMDINMPEKNGFEVLAELRRMGSKIPVLILSSYPAEEYRDAVIKEGAADYLTKEQSPSQLIDAIRNVFSNK